MQVRISVVEGPDTGETFLFERRDRFVVGRDLDCQLCVLNDGYFSRFHFMIEVDPPNVLLVDLNSRNGTFLNHHPEPVREVSLRHGDLIRGGNTVIRIELISAPETLPLEQTIPDTPSHQRYASISCLRCGADAPAEMPRASVEDTIYFCAPCREALRHEPLVLPGYQVVRELGCGGMGCVYLALQQSTGRVCAIKQVIPKAAMSEQMRQRFLREARQQAQLQHPGVVQVYELYEPSPGRFCMVMEYVPGQDGGKMLRESGQGRLDPWLAVMIVAKALEPLGFAHSQGVVHRDIKDGNIIVAHDQAGNLLVKLADFGLAKSYVESGASGFTRSGDLSGTIPYMAPEQLLNFKHVKPAADIYSMGATLYRLLTGCYTHDFTDGFDAMLKILQEPIVPLLTRVPTLPPLLASAVEQSLAREPEHRYVTAEAMREAILNALSRAYEQVHPSF